LRQVKFVNPLSGVKAVRSFIFVNQSCYRRQEEIAMVRRFLFVNGYSEASNLEQTDMVIFFTCAFCKSRIADMLQEIQRIRSVIKTDCELIVGSCLPATGKEDLQAVFDGKTISPTDFSALNLLPGISVRIEEMEGLCGKEGACSPQTTSAGMGAQLPEVPLVGVATRLPGDNRLGLFIASGCLRKCSYCAIRFATGKLRSKPLETVTQSLEVGLEKGYRRFEIYADSLGDYGLDIGTNLGELLKWLLHHNGEFTVGIYDLHPQAFLKYFDAVAALCKASKVHYLYVPLQSGNARILKLMNRPCNLEVLRAKLNEVRDNSSVFLQTGVMVGFPSETDEDFQETVALLEEIQFSDIYVHFYSDMPNTDSSKMPDKVGRECMQRRLSQLEDANIRFDRIKTRHEWSSIPVIN
jgi:MiaB/RimO family radical SAM methylthiotransferase